MSLPQCSSPVMAHCCHAIGAAHATLLSPLLCLARTQCSASTVKACWQRHGSNSNMHPLQWQQQHRFSAAVAATRQASRPLIQCFEPTLICTIGTVPTMEHLLYSGMLRWHSLLRLGQRTVSSSTLSALRKCQG